MSLIANVQSRVPTQTLAELTRQKDTTPGTVNTTILQRACDDVESGEFPLSCGVTYDDTDVRHVIVAVEAVILTLRSYLPAFSEGLSEDRDRWSKRAEALKKQTQLDRIRPRTTSILSTATEQVDDETVRPDFDRSRFDDVLPEKPLPGGRASDA